jgi:pyruvate/2-oxoacid:ferredoxin oxidoreductase beta subunit
MSTLTNPFRFVSAPPSWQLRIHDTFAGSDGASISGRTPDTVSNGNTWGASLFASTPTNATISSNNAVVTNQIHQIAISAAGGVAVEASVTASTVGGTAAVAGGSTTGTERVGIDLQASSTNRYFRVEVIAGQGWSILRNNGGTVNVVATGGDGTTFATGTTHILRIERVGDNLRVLVNEVEVYDATQVFTTGGSDVGFHGFTATGTKYVNEFKAYEWA